MNPQLLFMAAPLALGWIFTTYIFVPTHAPLRYGLLFGAPPGFALGAAMRLRVLRHDEIASKWHWVSAAFYGLIAAGCWTVFGAGAVEVLNALPLNEPKAAVTVSGTISRLDRQNITQIRRHPGPQRYYCTAVLSSGYTVRLTRAEFERLRVGDAYQTTMLMGRLGIPFQVADAP